MEYIKKRHSDDSTTYSKIYYIGDGRNDVCPSLKLSDNDVVFARRDYPLHKQLKNNTELKAKLQMFEDGHCIWQTLQRDAQCIENNN